MDANDKTGMEDFFSAWMKSATDFWQNMANTEPIMFGPPDTSKDTRQKHARQIHKAWKTGMKTFQAMASSVGQPDNIEAMMKGTDQLPEFMLNMVQHSWDGFVDMQKKMVDRAVRIGQHTEAYNFEDMDQEVFKTLREIYQNEFQKFLNAPQLGLTRFYQERFNQFTDKYCIFQTALNEFLYVFYVPIEKSFGVLQEKIEEMAEQGEVSDNFKDYYNMWIKILEGHYMKLLQSPEYTKVMNETIHALVEYKKAREQLLYDVFQDMPIPTNKDMDEVYKDLYILKKMVKKLSKKIEES